jgi:hypothetical protein
MRKKMYSFRADFDDIKTIKKLNSGGVGQFIRQAITEKLDRLLLRNLEINSFQTLSNNEKIIYFTKQIELRYKEIEEIQKDIDYQFYLKVQELLANYGCYVERIYGSKELDFVKKQFYEANSDFRKRKINVTKRENEYTTRTTTLTYEEITLKWLKAKESEGLRFTVIGAFSGRIAEIEAEIKKYRKKIAELQSE